MGIFSGIKSKVKGADAYTNEMEKLQAIYRAEVRSLKEERVELPKEAFSNIQFITLGVLVGFLLGVSLRRKDKKKRFKKRKKQKKN